MAQQPSYWTLVRHAAFDERGDEDWSGAVQAAELQSIPEIIQAVRLGGLVFADRREAEREVERINRPIAGGPKDPPGRPDKPGKPGRPHADGRFEKVRIGKTDRAVFVPRQPGAGPGHPKRT